MTDKLPVVGKRYKDKSGSVFKLKDHSIIRLDYPDWWTEFCFEEMKISCPLKHFFDNFEELPEDKAETECSVGKKSNCKRCEKEFLQHHRSDYYCSNYCKNMIAIKAKPETQSLELSHEVKEAMEKLREEIKTKNWMPYESIRTKLSVEDYYRLKTSANNLLNALDKQFNLNGYFEGLPPSKETIDKQFMSKEEDKIDVKQKHVDSVKVNETSKSVDVKEEEVNKNISTAKNEDLILTNNGVMSITDYNKIQAEEVADNKKEESIWKPMTSLIKNPVIPQGFWRGNKNCYIAFSVIGNWTRSEVVEFISKRPDGEFVSLDDFFEDYEATKQELSELKERVKKLETLIKESS